MDCSSARQHCQPFLDGELSSELASQLRSHLDACGGCAHQFQHQKQFHGLVRRTLVQASASTNLRERVNAVLIQSTVVREVAEASAVAPSAAASPRPIAKPIPMKPYLSGFPGRSSVAVAAVLMLSLAGTGFYAKKMCSHCPVMVAAQNAHDHIAASVPSTLVESDDPVKLTSHINNTLRVLPGFAGVPNLADCQLKAVSCGAIEIEGLPPGVFIKFVECKCQDEPITLLVLNTQSLPGGDEDHGFITSNFSGHSVISWKSTKDSLVYMLVTKLPLKDVMHVAEVARR
jgi:mycothiol system anti-sigma-R factor